MIQLLKLCVDKTMEWRLITLLLELWHMSL